jgi:hypothetical protein
MDDRKPQGYWTEERLRRLALQYDTRSRFQKQRPGAYQRAYKLDILDSVCAHMNPKQTWDVERVCQEAAKYRSKREFIKQCWPGYRAARRLGVVDLACEHMPAIQQSERSV